MNREALFITTFKTEPVNIQLFKIVYLIFGIFTLATLE